MKCRTCKHWTQTIKGIGNCSGITASPTVISIPNSEKRKGKLMVKPGITIQSPFVMTPDDFYCKNWRRK